MADTKSTVNDQVVDATTETSVGVIGESPAFAMGALYQASAQAMALMLQNSANSQLAMQQLNVAVVSTAVAKIISMAPSSTKS